MNRVYRVIVVTGLTLTVGLQSWSWDKSHPATTSATPSATPRGHERAREQHRPRKYGLPFYRRSRTTPPVASTRLSDTSRSRTTLPGSTSADPRRQEALINNTTGHDNTASGTAALFANTTGAHNTACGYFALVDNTTGDLNTASGASALQNNTTGFNNTATGAFTHSITPPPASTRRPRSCGTHHHRQWQHRQRRRRATE